MLKMDHKRCLKVYSIFLIFFMVTTFLTFGLVIISNQDSKFLCEAYCNETGGSYYSWDVGSCKCSDPYFPIGYTETEENFNTAWCSVVCKEYQQTDNYRLSGEMCYCEVGETIHFYNMTEIDWTDAYDESELPEGIQP